MEQKQQTKRIDRGLVIAVCVCLAVVIAIVVALLVIPRVAAGRVKQETLAFLEQNGETRISLVDPLAEGEGLFSNAQRMIAGEEAEALKRELTALLRESRYLDTEEAAGGAWSLHVTVYFGEGRQRIDLRENALCLEREGRVTLLEPSEETAAAYEALREELKKSLAAE